MRFQIFLAILLVFFGVFLITAAFFVPNNPRHGLYQAGIQQAAFLHPPRHGLCCKVRHDYKRGGGDKRERSSEDRATAQALHIIPHLHLRLHLSSPRALFLDKTQIQAIVVIVVKVVKLIFDSAPQLLRSYEGNESVARIVRHLFSNSTYIKL